jgi:hypothetical protein
LPGSSLALPVQQAPSEPAQPSAQADRGFDAGEAQDAGALKPLRQTQNDGGKDYDNAGGVNRHAMD